MEGGEKMSKTRKIEIAKEEGEVITVVELIKFLQQVERKYGAKTQVAYVSGYDWLLPLTFAAVVEENLDYKYEEDLSLPYVSLE